MRVYAVEGETRENSHEGFVFRKDDNIAEDYQGDTTNVEFFPQRRKSYGPTRAGGSFVGFATIFGDKDGPEFTRFALGHDGSVASKFSIKG